MSATSVKMHWIRDDQPNRHPRKIITHCGKEAWEESGDEFSTVLGDMIEAHTKIGKVTCGRCLKSAERIEKSPWGCKRVGA